MPIRAELPAPGLKDINYRFILIIKLLSALSDIMLQLNAILRFIGSFSVFVRELKLMQYVNLRLIL